MDGVLTEEKGVSFVTGFSTHSIEVVLHEHKYLFRSADWAALVTCNPRLSLFAVIDTHNVYFWLQNFLEVGWGSWLTKHYHITANVCNMVSEL